MPETPDLFAEVAMLRDQVDDMNRSVSALTRRSGALQDILEEMQKDEVLAEVFLAVDGTRSQAEIVEVLKKGRNKPSQTTVSRKLDKLVEDWDLIRPHTRSAKGIVLTQTSLARALKVERQLRKLPPWKG
ncbi:MAG: hypothetical protein ACJ71Z_09935 [Aeromicrobium sp.]